MAYALVFSGQGGQHPAMFQGLLDTEAHARVAAAVGTDWRERLAEPGWSTLNAVAQPLLTALAVEVTQALLAELPPPEAVAGHSVGELAAFHAAGVLGPAQAVALARRRAHEMDQDGALQATGLAGFSGLPLATVAGLCAQHGVALAIRHAPDSMVLGGPLPALHAATGAAVALGGQVTPLPVGLASHTRWMAGAAERFAAHLAGEPFADPRCRLVTNQASWVRRADAARLALAAQLATTVAWDECMDALRQTRVDAVLEIGAGRALTRMFQRRAPELPVRAVDDFRSLPAVLQWLRRCGGV